MAYQTAVGWNNAGALVTLAIQPRATVAEYARIRMALSGLTYADGYLRQEWVYGYLTTTQYASVLTALGLASAQSALMTVRTTDRERDEGNWNAIIYRPTETPEQYSGRLFPVRFPLALVEAL